MAYKTLNDRLEKGVDLQKAIIQNMNSYKVRMRRLNRKVEFLITNHEPYFITFTIAPDQYDKKLETYVRKIKQILKDTSQYYIFNIDYGSKNERLHFHALAHFKNKLDYTYFNSLWKYGLIYSEYIKRPDVGSLRRYISKITNHTVKGTASKIYFGKIKYWQYF